MTGFWVRGFSIWELSKHKTSKSTLGSDQASYVLRALGPKPQTYRFPAFCLRCTLNYFICI